MNDRDLCLRMLREFGRPATLSDVCAMFPNRASEAVLEMLLYLNDLGSVQIHSGCSPFFPRQFEATERNGFR